MTGATKQFDLIVVGGSFAGYVAAKRAAARGLSVAVLDKKKEPGAHVHTTGILVREAAEELAVPRELVRKIEGVRLYAPNLKHVDLASPGYYFLATNTPDLLRWLAAEAEQAGATLYPGTAFETATRTDGGFEIPKPRIAGRYLLGADGARSTVAEWAGLGRNTRFLVGLEMELDRVPGLDPRFLHTFLDSNIAPGYIGWLVPGAGVVQLGLACKRADKPNLTAFVEKVSTLFDVTGGNVVERRSGVIPVGGVVRPAAAERLLLVGDAAGMVSPMTAGGIYTAFHFGKRAADTIADFLAGEAPDPATFLTREYPRFRVKSAMRRMLDLGPPNWLLNLGVGTRPMQALAKLVFFHTKGLKSKEAWKDVVRG